MFDLIEFQQAQLRLNKAAVALCNAEDDLLHARMNDYQDIESYRNTRDIAKHNLCGASREYTNQCRTAGKEYEPCLSNSPST